MRCPTLAELPPPPPGKTGWPWTVEARQMLASSAPDGKLYPRISVAVPSFNQGRFIEETLRSILLQGYPDMELIVMDGGSRDETADVIRKYEMWISHWTSAPDGGQTQAINNGWRLAGGDFISWLNSDDLLMPEWAENVALALLGDEKLGLVLADALIVDADSRFLSVFRGSTPDLRRMVMRWQAFAQPGFLMRREVLEACGFLDERMQFAMDFEYWVRLLGRGITFGYLPKSLAATRLHPSSKTSNLYRTAIGNLLEIIDKFSSEAPAHLQSVALMAKERAFWNAAYLAFVSGDGWLSRRYAARYAKTAGVKAIPKAAALCALSLLGVYGRDLLGFYQVYQNSRTASNSANLK